VSRRRGNNQGNRQNRGKQPPRDNITNNASMRITIVMQVDGTIEVDPKFNQAAIKFLDTLYDKAERDDYDKRWEDDHKIAFFQYQIFDEILSQYDDPPSADDIDPTPGVQSMRDAPVRDVIDIATMPRAGSSQLN
jgi:hypothetical protein